MVFAENWKKKIGYFAFLMGATAILFMSARAFYLGLALLVVALALFFVLRRFGTKQNFSLKKVGLFVGLFVVALVVFSAIQRYLYPVNQDSKEKFNTGIWERMSTIKTDESSINARLTTWKRSFKLIAEHPILGVGTGNWKIEVLKYEAPMADNHIISYKNHNDFIEVTAETGLLGGIIYLSVFALIFFGFFKQVLKRPANEDLVKNLFLPALGILAYSVDAFFNFPNDRPEIQVLFAMYVAMAIAFAGLSFSTAATWQPKILKYQQNIKAYQSIIVKTCLAITLTFFAIILYMNAVSLHFQSMAVKEIRSGKNSHSASFFNNGFPRIPNLSCEGDPISTLIAHFLIDENRADEAVTLLKTDNPSPYDGRREYYLCLAYEKMGIADSAIYWGLRSCILKPRFANMVIVTSSKLFAVGRQQEAVQTMDNYLALVKTNPSAWLLAADQNLKMGNKQKAIVLMDSAKKYLSENWRIKNNWEYLRQTNTIPTSDEIYIKAKQAMDAKLYPKALQLLNEYIGKQPDNTEAYQKRALCFYFLQQFQKSLSDIEKALQHGDGSKGFLLNLKGVNYINLSKTNEACIYFKKAMEVGDVDGAENYKKFCVKK
ncbi:MAG: O-antigen ligase family protein, partial [Bacteroidales bacterium]